jgi:hypothetical protein
VLPALAALLRDGDAGVRLAAVEALSAAALRHDARAMARTWLTPAAHGPDRAVADAARAALERLR